MTRSTGIPAFTMTQLAAFIAVAEAGTISGAAEQLHVSPSTLSASVTELERHLQTQLLHRQKAKGVTLTPSGELLLPRAQLLLHQADELQTDARGKDGKVTGRVRLGCYPSLSPTVLPTVLTAFQGRHPDAQLEAVEQTQDELTQRLLDGRLDLAIMYDLDLASTWRTATLSHLRPRVVLPQNHRLTHSDEPINLAELRDEPMVLLDAPPSSGHAYACCREAGFIPNVIFRARTYETARSFVGRGLGWTLLVQRPPGDVTYEGNAVAVREVATPELADVGVCLVWNPDSLLSKATRTFITETVRLAESGSLPLPRKS